MGKLFKLGKLLDFKSTKEEKFIDRILELKLTYLSKGALLLLTNTIKIIEKNGIKGDIIEMGCALGGSTLLIAKAKNKKRLFKVYDSFEMMPAPGQNDENDVHKRYKEIVSGNSKGIGEDLYYGYEPDLLVKVKENFTSFNISIKNRNIKFVKGFYDKTLEIEKPVALAHIDCDWYNSVKLSLEKITPYLSVGGFLIIDDYYYYSGCKKATDEYFADKKDQFNFLKKERFLVERLR